MIDLSDEQLAAVYVATGEMRFFDEIANRYTAQVRAMIYPVVLNHADTDDLTQETMLRVVRHLPSFRAKARLSTWIYRIAMNTTKDFMRKRKRNPVRSHSELSASDTVQEPITNPVAHDAAQLDRDIERALKKMSPALRVAMNLTAINGMDAGEAAKAAGCLRSSMYRRIHEAREFLRKELAEYLS